MNALLLVDIQNDFLPGGALAVAEGDQVIPIANRLQAQFALVLVTQDWHPLDHGSFASSHPGKRPGDVIELHGLRQILWPVHCVHSTPGAAFGPGLNTTRFSRVFRKGTDPGIDSYSGFFDNGHLKATGLAHYLTVRKVPDIFIAGLTTDYCVKYTALDGVTLGFRVHVILDGCRGVNLNPGDVDAAIAEMRKAGVQITDSSGVP
jgi:nicotinamidase/pyrazinamidase